MKTDYHINIFYSADDEAYVADIPDLPHCSALGATPAEALRELTIARELWLDAAREEGRPIPAPRYRPAVYELAGTGAAEATTHLLREDPPKP
jgi:predicted RNase H-like HicB family nuclease